MAKALKRVLGAGTTNTRCLLGFMVVGDMLLNLQAEAATTPNSMTIFFTPLAALPSVSIAV